MSQSSDPAAILLLMVGFVLVVFAATSVLAALVLCMLPRPSIRALRHVRVIIIAIASLLGIAGLGMLAVAGTDEGVAPSTLLIAAGLSLLAWWIGRRQRGLQALANGPARPDGPDGPASPE